MTRDGAGPATWEGIPRCQGRYGAADGVSRRATRTGDNEVPRAARPRAPAVFHTLELENAVTRTRKNPDLVSRAPEAHPDHHLWKNGRTYWVAFTFHTQQGRKHRVRRSLHTELVDEARARRDALLRDYASRSGWRLALRYVAREARAESRPCSPDEARLPLSVPIVA